MRAPIKARRVVVNALSVDVEDYFQVWALSPWFPPSKWDQTPCRIERNLDVILKLLHEADARATFFTLGWIAERYPDAIRRIARAGHEIASHGYAHGRVNELDRDAFYADIHLAKMILEDIAGVEVRGYRAPSFSIGADNEWAHDCILEAGYRYSSSVYPIRHDHYGIPDAPRFAYRSRPALLEVPITTTRLFSRNWPAGGGGYFRLLPYARVAVVDQARERRGRATRDLLLPPLGARSRAAARAGHRREDPGAPLLEPRSDGRPAAPAARRLPLGSRRSRVPARGRVMARVAITAKAVDSGLRRGDGRRGRMKLGVTELPAGTATGELRVRDAAPADLARWDAFVERCPEATFFHKAGWKEVIESVFRHRTFYLLAERDATIVGVLPLAQVKSLLFGHALVSLPFCVYGGVAATDPAAVPALHAAARELAAQLGADHLELRNRIAREPDWPRQALYVTFRKEILPDVEANMLAIPRKQRAMVRKGIQRGLQGEIDASVDRFFALYADNVHRHGTPALPKRYFETLQRVFGRDVEVLTVLERGTSTIVKRPDFLLPGRGAAVLCWRRRGGTRPGGERLQVLGSDAPGVRAGSARLRLRPQQARHRVVRLQEELGLRARTTALRVRTPARHRDPGEQSLEPEVQGDDCRLAAPADRRGERDRAVHRAEPGVA